MRPSPGRRPLVALALAALLAGCHGVTVGGLGATPSDAATPLDSPTTAMASTLAALQTALATGGFSLGPPGQAYGPTEPAAFVRVPRTVARVPFADADDGVVIVYEFTDAAGAAAGAATLADYLATGYAQTTFPADTIFAVTYLGPTVVFSWFSADRSGDPVAARAAFGLIAGVGTRIRVFK